MSGMARRAAALDDRRAKRDITAPAVALARSPRVVSVSIARDATRDFPASAISIEQTRRLIMKKSRLILGCLAVVATLALAVGCMWPDYSLDFNAGPIDNYSTYSDIPYTISNTGSFDVSNVYITINVELSTGGTSSSTFSVGDVPAYGSTYLTFRFYHSAGVTVAEPRITNLSWDQN
jgi:hypothetical protein